MYTGIYFLPKTGDVAHQCRMYLRQCLLNHFRILVDRNRHSLMQAIIRPRFFKNMSQRQETHGKILIRHHRKADIMDTHGFQIIGMMKHDSFRFAGRPGSIYDGSQIFRYRFIHTDLYFCLGMCIIAQPKEIVKINRSLVFGVQLDCRIKHNQALQILGIFLYLECIIIL